MTDAAAALITAAQGLDAAGFMPSKSGNISLRTPRGFLITPSGLPYAQLHPEDLVELTPDGATLAGQRRPSSEWQLHADLYAARPDAGAIIHTHSPHATALSCARRPIPALHYMIAFAGGDDIRCSAYATFGTPELATQAVAALEGRRACLRSRTWRGNTCCCWRPALRLCCSMALRWKRWRRSFAAMAGRCKRAFDVTPPPLM
jgi:L-fuculose-phosphate aldolase